MNTQKYPNRDAIRDANDIYLDTMRPYIIHHLKRVQGENVKDLIVDSLKDNQRDEFLQNCIKQNDVASAIDFNYIPNIFNKLWQIVFGQLFNWDMLIQSMLWLIRDGRNICEHRGSEDLDFELTRMHLFLVANILKNINRTDKQNEVEAIRDQLLLDESSRRIASISDKLERTEDEMKNLKDDLKEANKENQELLKYKLEYGKLQNTLKNSEKDIEKTAEKYEISERKNIKLEKDLKETEDAWKESEQFLTDTTEKLDQLEIENESNLERIDEIVNQNENIKKSHSEVMLNYKKDKDNFERDNKLKEENLKITQDELEKNRGKLNDTNKELNKQKNENETNLEQIELLRKQIENSEYKHQEEINSIKIQLSSVSDEKSKIENHISSIRNQIQYLSNNNQLSTPVYPNLAIESTVRMVDRRNEDKKEYILNLIEKKHPTVFYVMNEEKVNQFIRIVGNKQSNLIGTHHATTTKDDETTLSERLEKGELSCIVSCGTFSHLITHHNIEHIVFCHLTPSLDVFVNRCQPAFLSKNHCFIHLIYDPETDLDYIKNSYPDRIAFMEFFENILQINGIKTRFLTIDDILSKLKMDKPTFEPLCNIFQEIGMIEKNKSGVKLLSKPKKKLEESTVFIEGLEERKHYQEFYDFQQKHTYVELWDKIGEKEEMSRILKDYNNNSMNVVKEDREEFDSISLENTDSTID